MVCRYQLPQTEILSVRLHLPRFAKALAWTEQRIASGQGGYVCHVDAHSLVLAQDDPALHRALSNADLTAADGMPLVWLGRRKVAEAERVYGPDLMRALLASPTANARHFLFGSTVETLAALQQRIAADQPRAQVVGSLSPSFGGMSEAEEAGYREAIRATGASVVWVGLGAPRQELWMARNAPHLPGVLLIGVGAAFDFLAGAKPQAPRWLRRMGLEWAFRWASEPRRLSRRYLWVIPRFLWLLSRSR